MSIMQGISAAWNFEFYLMPVLTLYLVFEIPSLIRRYYRWFYTPAYFMFFPLGHADQLYAQYFNEDDFYSIGQAQTPLQKRALRKRIVAISIFSMAFSTVVAPWLCGFIAAMILSSAQFAQFVGFLLVIKTATLLISLRKLRDVSFVYQSGSFAWVVVVYIAYLVLIWWGVTTSFSWAAASLAKVGFLGTVTEMAAGLYKEIFFSIALVSGITWAITYFLTNPDFIPPSHLSELEIDESS